MQKPVLYKIIEKNPISPEDFKSRPEVFEDLCQVTTPNTNEFYVVFFSIEKKGIKIIESELIRPNHQIQDICEIKDHYSKLPGFIWVCAPAGYSGKNIN